MKAVRTGTALRKTLTSDVRCALGTGVHDGSVVGDQRRVESGAMRGYVNKAKAATTRLQQQRTGYR